MRKATALKKTSLLLFTLILLTLTLTHSSVAQEKPPAPAAPLATERDPRVWREFTSAAGRFAVTLPGDMTLKTERMPTPDGGGIPLSIYTLMTSAEYGVIYADYPFEVKGAEMQRNLLDGGARGAVASVGSQLLDIKEVSLGEHPGRALKELMRDGRIMHVRLYLVGSRLYQVAITLPKLGEADPVVPFAEEVAAKFLDSFRLLDAGTQGGEVDTLIKSLREKGESVYGTKEPNANADWVVSKPQPASPQVAKSARVQGTVVVEIVVDEEGQVIAAQAKSGHPLLQAAAVKAAREARFKPAIVEGKRVKLSGVVTYNFVLQ